MKKKKFHHVLQEALRLETMRTMKTNILFFDPRLFSHILKTAPFNPVLLTYLVAMKTKHHLHVSKCAAFVDKMSTA